MARLLPSPSLDAWHSSLGGRVHLSPCVSLHLSPVVSPPGCLARLSGWTRSFVSLGSLVSLCLPSFVSRCLPAWMMQSGWTGSFVSLCHLSPVVSQPGCLARLSGWTGSFVSLCLPSFVSQPGARLGFICLPLSPFICLPLSPSLDAWVDRFTCLPLSPFICRPLSPSLGLARLSGWTGSCVSLCPLHLSPVLSQPGCLAQLSGWTGSFVSLCLPSFVSRCLSAWMPGTALCVDAFVCLPGFTCLPLSPFICLPLSPSLDDAVWVDGFICLPLSFVSRCLPAWMPGTALWVDGFICLPLSPFICLPAWMPGAARVHLSPFVSLHLSPVVSQPGCLGGQIHLSPFVSLHLSPVVSQPGSGTALWVDGFMCLPLSPSFVSRSLPAWMPGTALWVDGFICLPLSPLISPVVSQPGCLARLSGWTGSFVSLCLPSFVSHCLQPGCLARLSGFICLPLSPSMSGTPLFPFICLPLSPSLDACGTVFFVDRFTFLPLSPFIWLPLSPSLDVCHGSPGGRIHLSPLVPLHLSPISVGGRIHLFPFVSLYLSPVVSQPGCLARLSGWTDSFVSRCLPAWMWGTHAPRFPSLPAVLSFWRGLVCLRLWPWLRSFLVLWMLGTGSSSVCPSSELRFRLGSCGSSSLSIVGYTLSVRSVPRYQLRSRADDSGALRCAASATRRLC